MHLLVQHNTLYTIVVTTLETQQAPGVNTLSQVHKYTGFALDLSPFEGIYIYIYIYIYMKKMKILGRSKEQRQTLEHFDTKSHFSIVGTYEMSVQTAVVSI